MALKNLLKPILFSILLLRIFPSFAQIATTPYSMYGPGTEAFQGNVYSSGLGYSGIALQDSLYINTINPASFKRDSLDFTFEFAFIGKYNRLKASNTSVSDFTSNMNYMTAAFRIFNWWSTSIGLLPYSSSEYSIKYTENNPEIGEITHYLRGNGGINRIYWANSLKIKNLTIGANINYVFGYLSHYASVVLPGGNYYFNTSTKKQRNIKDFSYDFGLQYHFRIKNHKITIGAIYTPKQSLKSAEQILESKAIYLEYNRLDTIYYSETNAISTDFPEKYGFGVSVSNTQWLLTAEFLTENWTNTQWATSQNMTNSVKIHAGAEYTPKHNVLSEYFKKMSYRTGFYHEKTGLYINNTYLTKTGITLGAKMPLRKKKQSVNFSLDFGKYGTLANNLIEELYIQFRIGINLHETWFIKPKIN